jgi:hypothetical protein
MAKISKQQKLRLEKYNILRDDYLGSHPNCEVIGCNRRATEIHHKRGRVGNNLFLHFLAVCSPCHHRIEENPVWAKENHYSESRLL